MKPADEKPYGIFTPGNHRHARLNLAMAIMGLGMLAALAWIALQAWILGRTFPHDSFLLNPLSRFADLTDAMAMSTRPNPYVDPLAFYPPFAWLCLRPFAQLPDAVAVVVVLSLGMGGLYLLLATALRSVVPGPMVRVLYALLGLVTAYPVLFCFERGNIEIIVAVLIGGALWLMGRQRHDLAALCLAPAIALKLFPALLLVLFLRRGHVMAAVGALLAAASLTLGSVFLLALPIQSAWLDYQRDLVFCTRFMVYENFTLDACNSPWNAGKLALVTAGHYGLVDPVDFSFDGPFIQRAYLAYTGGVALVALVLVIYAVLIERQFRRSAVALLLFLSIGAPQGGDYRMIYAGMALVLLIAAQSKRPHDWLVLVLLALTMVPKKEILLAFAGKTESAAANVSTDVLVDPVLILVALGLLMYDTCVLLRPGMIRSRSRALIGAIIPGAGKMKT